MKEETSPTVSQEKHEEGLQWAPSPGGLWSAANEDEDGNDDNDFSPLFSSSTKRFSLLPAETLYWLI